MLEILVISPLQPIKTTLQTMILKKISEAVRHLNQI